MYKLLAIVGKSACGKDTILKRLAFEQTKLKISYTTRPKRDYEVDGVDYHFKNEKYFLENINNFFEIDNFRGWYYGTKYEDLSKEKINIGIFTPKALDEIKESPNINCIPVFIDASDKIRLIRSLSREKNPDIKEIIRRYNTDEIDFLDIKSKVYMTLYNNKKEDLANIIIVLKDLIDTWVKER